MRLCSTAITHRTDLPGFMEICRYIFQYAIPSLQANQNFLNTSITSKGYHRNASIPSVIDILTAEKGAGDHACRITRKLLVIELESPHIFILPYNSTKGSFWDQDSQPV